MKEACQLHTTEYSDRGHLYWRICHNQCKNLLCKNARINCCKLFIF